MNARSNDTERHSLAIGVWDNEGGAQVPDSADRQYGRRIEADRTWTVYHVFTGVPAYADGQAMTGLSRSKATDGMVSLNRRNDARRLVERKASNNRC
ncbi:hypothetical protein CYK37_26535 [Mesorhizobium loti]|nr:hypothetical protein [Mesorhizobium loti]PLP56332.1 hypothetical protein CYK37_26535 [Mesorhizobium loti]